MQKFSSGLVIRLNMLSTIGIGLYICGNAFDGLAKTHGGMDWNTVVSPFLLGIASVFAGLSCMIATFTVYKVNREGVTRRGWNGTRHIRWADVTRVDVSGLRQSPLTLYDGRGRKLAIQRSLMDKKRLMELNDVLEPHLASFRERQLRKIEGGDSVYHLPRMKAWEGAIVLAMLVFAYVYAGAMPVQDGTEWVHAFVRATMGGLILFLLWTMVSAYTQTWTVTPQDLTHRTLFGTRRIQFPHVVSMSSYAARSIIGSHEVTTIEGDNHKITFTARLMNYALLKELLQQRVNTTPRAPVETQPQTITTAEQKQRRVMLPTGALVLFLIVGGLGLMDVRDGQARMARYRLLDAHGQTATGYVTGVSSDGAKGERYLLRYRFTNANRAPRDGVSPVSYDDYRAARIGEPARVTYLLDRRDVTTVPQSIGERRAQRNIANGYIVIGIACLSTPLLALAPFLPRKRTLYPAG